MTHASIVPLIGGSSVASTKIFKKEPEYILSYSPFTNNDQHCVAYYPDVPYILLDKEVDYKPKYVDVISATCPCAGLSSLSPTAKSDAAANCWMHTTADYVLGKIKPRVFWGENSGHLASARGEPTVTELRRIAKKHGYTFMIYKTKSILHGLSQVRDRAFYFFFKGKEIPLFPFIKREHELIENTIRKAGRRKTDPMNVLTSERIPSQEPMYRYVLEVIMGGMSHPAFQKQLKLSNNPLSLIEDAGHSYKEVARWMKQNGYDKMAKKAIRIGDKLDSGGNIMRKTTEIPAGHIGAFVGHMPMQLTHPDEDRFLTIRECLHIMGLPKDFILQGGVKNLNHICQNVPVGTATDMCKFIQTYLNGETDASYLGEFAVIDNKSQKYYRADGTDMATGSDSDLTDFI